jgi:hypothetical protein
VQFTEGVQFEEAPEFYLRQGTQAEKGRLYSLSVDRPNQIAHLAEIRSATP